MYLSLISLSQINWAADKGCVPVACPMQIAYLIFDIYIHGHLHELLDRFYDPSNNNFMNFWTVSLIHQITTF